MIREATNVNRPAIGPEQDVTNHSNSGPNSGRPNAFRLAAAILVCFAICSHAETASSAIAAKYASLGGSSGFLGASTSGVVTTADGGAYQTYKYGNIYWSQATTAHEVHGLILAKYNVVGGPASFGYPVTDETSGKNDSSLRYNHFQRGTIDWKSAPGAHEVHGDIWLKYMSLGGPDGFLATTLTDETGSSDGSGRYNTFEGGSIYWTMATGAHEVHGLICGRWAALGFERSYLGYPVSDEQVTPNLAINGTAQGRFSVFQHGRIYYTPSSGAVDVQDLAEVWEPRQKSDFRSSTIGPRKVLTIIYNTYTTPGQVNPACVPPDPSCGVVMPVPTVGDIQSVLFGTRPNEPPPNPSLPRVFADDFFSENSGPAASSAPGRMRLLNAGILSIDAPSGKRGGHYWSDAIHQPGTTVDGWLNPHQERDHDAITLAIAQITQSGSSFAAYDTNHDGMLTSDELAILVVCAGEKDWGDMVHLYGGYYSSGAVYDFKAGGVDGPLIRNPNHWDIVEWFTHPASKSPISLGLPTHELGHLLVGVPDLYNPGWKYDAGVFSRMGAPNSDRETTHFDPLLKLKAKWLDYTALAGTGQYTYTLRNIEQFGEAVVLYEPSLSRKEYFILEYRKPGTSYDAGRTGTGDGKGLPNAGLAVWHVIEDQTLQNNLMTKLIPIDNRKPDNWYRAGVLLQRANGGVPLDDTQALYTSANTPIYLTWSDGSGPGFKVVLQTSVRPGYDQQQGVGTSTPPDAITLTITR